MKSLYPLQHRFAGILLCLLGAFILSGWMLSNEVMIRVVPGSPAVTINTALMLVLAGFCLLTAEQEGTLKQLYLGAALALLALSLTILSQNIFHFNLGIDAPQTHAALGDVHAYPGRTSPNACIGFFCAGMIFILSRNRASGVRHRHLCLTLAGLIIVLGVLALLGYVLHLEAMYQFATYNRMATLTAIGVSVLGIGTWNLSSNMKDHASETAVSQARRIIRLSATLLTVFAVTAGLTGFAVLRHGFEETAKNNLHNAAKTSAFIISSEIDNGLLVSRSIANRVSLRELLSNLENNPTDENTMRELRAAGESLVDSGFLRVHITTVNDQRIVTHGRVDSPTSTIDVPMNGDATARLLWHDGFVLRHAQEIIRDGNILGKIITEWPLQDLTNFVTEAQAIGESNDLALCGRALNEVACFPSRFDKTPFSFEQVSASKRLAYPVMLALAGKTGATTATDLRDIVVQAGYAPIPDYQLGVMIKKDIGELYSALRDRLNLLIAALLLFVGAGTLLIRNWVQPLVEQIVTEQRRIEAILNNSNDGFIAVNADGSISDWNIQAEKILGWTALEAVGQNLTELIISERQRPQHYRTFERFLETKTGRVANQRLETTVVRSDGSDIPVELSIASFHTGKDFGASIFLRDLTDIKLAEQQVTERAKELEAAHAALVQSQKLEAVGKLTGGVAHDFNNVLQVVQGSLQLLQLETSDDNTDEKTTEKRIATAMSAVDRGAKLSAQLLAFARKQPLQPKVRNLAGVINGMGEMLRRVLGDAIEIEIITSDRPWNILVDPNQLENVILNLAINARDAMQSVGKLTIEVSNCVLNEDFVRAEQGLNAGDFVMLSISDTGPGIPADIMDKVFEPFFTTKPEGEGTGLGLSMAHGFVKQSNGHIAIFSEIGQGTTLRLYLPRSFEQEEYEAPLNAGKTDGGHETILVVEDDLAVQATVIDTLTGLGYKVHKANNAEAALKLLKKYKKIDLLFTDVVMPGTLRSPELAKLAQALNPNIKVLFTSGYTRNAIESGGRLDSGVHLLSKPYGRDQLARKLRELLGHSEQATKIKHNVVLPKAEIDQANFKIVFVEDNEDSRIAVSKMLELIGYQVESFSSAEAAFTRMQTEMFNVLLTDVTLPGMSGIQLAIRVHAANADIRIIFASGNNDVFNDKVNFDFKLLPKPFTLDQLVECLETP